MTNTEQDLQQSSGSGTGPSKSLESKGVKECLEKFPEIKKPIEVVLEKELEEVEENVKQAKTTNVSDPQTPAAESVNVNCNAKTPQLEKRKQEGNEWKTLKKIDYQRLETVLEEVQCLGEATSAKTGYESGKSSAESEQLTWDVGYGRPKRPWFYNLVSITEHPEVLSSDETQSEEEQEKQKIDENERNVERCDKLGSAEGQGEPAEKKGSGKFNPEKKSVLLNGMVEILPIFSNDKFVCSRDAISIEECEELDSFEKAPSGKFIIESKTSKDIRTVDIKPFHSMNSMNSMKKGFRDRVTEKMENFRETVGTTLHCSQRSIFTDNNGLVSSPFINFLLVLTPFAEERQKLLQEKKAEGDGIECTDSILKKRRAVQGGGLPVLRVIYSLILTTLGALSVGFGVAWKFHQPPGVLDVFLSFFPFMHTRRTYFRIFYDKLIQILAALFGDLCRHPVLPY